MTFFGAFAAVDFPAVPTAPGASATAGLINAARAKTPYDRLFFIDAS
jgi:hypothetical protein